MSSTYQTFQSARGEHVSVKAGFCWPAFFVGPFWALYHRLWSVFARLIVVWVSLIVIDESVVQPSGSLPMLVAMLVAYVSFLFVCGKFGNSWRVNNLLNSGHMRLGSEQQEQAPNAPASAEG